MTYAFAVEIFGITSVIIMEVSDMDNRHVKDILMSSNNPDEYYLGYSASGAVTFSIVEKD